MEEKRKEEKRKEFFFRLDGFPVMVKDRLQLVWRYFRTIAESSELGRYAEIETINEKKIVLGMTTDGYYVDEDDFFAIYETLSDILKEANDLNKMDMELPPLAPGEATRSIV